MQSNNNNHSSDKTHDLLPPKDKQSNTSEIIELVKPIVILEAASAYYKLKLAKKVLVKSAVIAKKAVTVVGKNSVAIANHLTKIIKKSNN